MSAGASATSPVHFGRFTFDRATRQLTGDGVPVHLTPKAFDLLSLLIAEAPRVVPKEEIHRHLWPDSFVSDASLLGLFKEVRHALEDDGSGTTTDPTITQTPDRGVKADTCRSGAANAGPRTPRTRRRGHRPEPACP